MNRATKIFRIFCKRISNFGRKFFGKNFVIAAIFTAVGALSVLMFQYVSKSKSHNISSYEQFFDDDFFGSFAQKNNEIHRRFFKIFNKENDIQEIFEEMEEINKDMYKSMIDSQKRMQQFIENSRKNSMISDDKDYDSSDKSKNFVKMRQENDDSNLFFTTKEDEKQSSYEINFRSFDPEKITVKIEEKFLIFETKNHEQGSSKSQDSGQQKENSVSKAIFEKNSSFRYAIRLRKEELGQTPEIIRQQDKIIVKFTKKSVVN